MNWKKQNDEVLYSKKKGLLCIGKKDVDYLKKISSNNPRNRARFCAHSSIDDEVHEMIIFHKKGTYVRPHKHLFKTESFHLIEGEADALIFDEKGKLIQLKELGEYKTGKSFYYRVPDSCYHMQIFRKDTVFHEVTKGPFQKEDTVFPDWAPEEGKKLSVSEYLEYLESQLIKLRISL